MIENGDRSKDNGSNIFKSSFWHSFGTGNIVTIAAVVGSAIAVYTDIRINLAVEQDKISQISRDIDVERKSHQEFASDMRIQINQISKDVSYLSGLLGKSEVKLK